MWRIHNLVSGPRPGCSAQSLATPSLSIAARCWTLRRSAAMVCSSKSAASPLSVTSTLHHARWLKLGGLLDVHPNLALTNRREKQHSSSWQQTSEGCNYLGIKR